MRLRRGGPVGARPPRRQAFGLPLMLGVRSGGTAPRYSSPPRGNRWRTRQHRGQGCGERACQPRRRAFPERTCRGTHAVRTRRPSRVGRLVRKPAHRHPEIHSAPWSNLPGQNREAPGTLRRPCRVHPVCLSSVACPRLPVLGYRPRSPASVTGLSYRPHTVERIFPTRHTGRRDASACASSAPIRTSGFDPLMAGPG